MLTVIVKASEADVHRTLGKHMKPNQYATKSAGRFVAVQSPEFDKYTEDDMWDIAGAHGFRDVLVEVKDLPKFGTARPRIRRVV